MSVEGLWLARTTQVGGDQTPMAPVIVVLETGRLFGGDSSYFHVGSYVYENAKFSGSCRVQTHTQTEGMENVFGMHGPVDYQVEFAAQFVGDLLVGQMRPMGVDIVLDVVLTKLADLPG